MAQDGIAEEEREKASRDLADICTLGRIRDESLSIPNHIQEQSSSVPITPQDQIDKKRSAGGY